MASVGINLTWLDPGVVGGSEEYSIRLVRSLSERAAQGMSFRVYCRQSVLDRYPDIEARFPVEIMPSPRPGRATRVALENTWMAYHRRSDHLVHHMGGVVPWIGQRCDIVTVYDLQPLEMPHNFGVVKRRWLAASIPHSVHSAQFVISPSKFTGDRLVECLNVPRQKIRLVPFGFESPAVPETIDLVTSTGGQAPDSDSDSDPESDSDRELGRFLLYPAITYRHKRHVDLIQALALLPSACDDIKLVFTGRAGPETLQLRRLAADLGLASRVVFTGRIPEEDLIRLYRRAVALVFPSAYEGFGNPCLEAMIHGCPIITSNGGSLPEVTGPAAIHVGVGDSVAWADAIAKLAGSQKLAEHLIGQGRLQLCLFEPEAATDRLLSVYDEALG